MTVFSIAYMFFPIDWGVYFKHRILITLDLLKTNASPSITGWVFYFGDVVLRKARAGTGFKKGILFTFGVILFPISPFLMILFWILALGASVSSNLITLFAC